MRLKLILQYHGQPYGGWQYQRPSGAPRKPSVQGEVVKAFNQLLNSPQLVAKQIIAAGRTDAGVHALGQVVHVDLPEEFATRPVYSWMDGLNRFLPLTIRVVLAEVVQESFHARFSASARHYQYRLWLGRQVRPDLLGVVGHAPPIFGTEMNLTAMQAAVATLPVGVPTDFSSFRDAECQSKNPRCTLSHLTLANPEPNLLFLNLGADHFLHHMVRNIVGTLVQVGMNERNPDLSALLTARDRRLAGTTFAPDGLFLVSVDYPPLTVA